jgi:hypothetical protein
MQPVNDQLVTPYFPDIELSEPSLEFVKSQMFPDFSEFANAVKIRLDNQPANFNKIKTT